MVIGMAMLFSAQAQSISSTWTYDALDAGTGLNPDKYGGVFRPSALLPDTGSASGGSIALSGLTSGGLGSAGYPDGYGGVYTFMSANPSYTLSTSTILLDVNIITISFWAGGGNPTPLNYTASSLVLNYNGGSQGLASSYFYKGTNESINTPIGPQTGNRYIWSWENITNLGSLTDFSTQWDSQNMQHTYLTDISLIQSVPEPSTLVFLLTGTTLFLLRRKRSI